MKIASVFTIVITLLLLMSCEESEEANVSNEIADFEVSGMVCQMGCGGAIRKELYASGFVDQVDVNFEEEAPSNVISVHFNSNKITVEQIEKLIETINDGQFKADFKSSSKKTPETVTESASSPSNDSKRYFLVEDKSFSFPNLTDLLNSLVR